MYVQKGVYFPVISTIESSASVMVAVSEKAAINWEAPEQINIAFAWICEFVFV